MATPVRSIAPVDALAADGTIVRIRPLGRADGPAVRALHSGISHRNMYLRFFTENPAGAVAYAALLAAADPASNRIALLAERSGRLVGVATCEPTGAVEGEIAFLVDDDCHGLGIGTLLLQHLAAAARDRGIERFRADVLAQNAEMLRLFADSGFAEHATFDHEVAQIEMSTSLDELTLRQIAARERQAAGLSRPGEH